MMAWPATLTHLTEGGGLIISLRLRNIFNSNSQAGMWSLRILPSSPFSSFSFEEAALNTAKRFSGVSVKDIHIFFMVVNRTYSVLRDFFLHDFESF